MKIEQRTDVGNVRKINEDLSRNSINSLGDRLLLVADGMGGHKAGEVASFFAATIVEREFLKLKEQPDYKEFIAKTVSKANREIYSEALINSQYEKMGTTLSFLIDTGEKCYIGHVGDSRIYYIKDDKIRQITKDHTMVQMLFEEGKITEAEIATHPYRNVLLQSLGTNKTVSVDVSELIIPNYGYILICSDGLIDELSDIQLLEILKTDLPCSKKADYLMHSALSNEGKDNITFILMERGV